MPPQPSPRRRCRSSKYQPFVPLVLPDRTWPNAHRQGAAVVLRRPARRQPGADRPDGPGAQAAHVRGAGEDGLQGDRGRLPVGEPARLRLRPPAHRGGPDPRRRHDPGADAVPPRADRAHLRVPRRARRGRSCTSTTRPTRCSARSCSASTRTASSTSPSTPPSCAASSRRRCADTAIRYEYSPESFTGPSSTSPSRSARR